MGPGHPWAKPRGRERIAHASRLIELLTVFQREGFAGLEEQRTRPASHPENQLSLPLLKQVLEVQHEHPRAGRFRVRGIMAQRTHRAPSEATIGRAMALNREHHGAPPAWRTDRPAAPHADAVKDLLYEPAYRHRYWCIDFRYLIRIGADRHWVYSLLFLEGYSRKILAGMATEHQDGWPSCNSCLKNGSVAADDG